MTRSQAAPWSPDSEQFAFARVPGTEIPDQNSGIGGFFMAAPTFQTSLVSFGGGTVTLLGPHHPFQQGADPAWAPSGT